MELLAIDTGPRDRFDLEGCVISILAARGELEDERLAAWRELAKSLADPQRAAGLEATSAEIAWLRGDFAEAVGAGLRLAAYPGRTVDGLWMSRRGALWLGDAPTLAAVLRRLEEVPDRSRLAKAGRLQASAGLAALEGRTADAITASQSARSVLAGGGFTLDSALAALDFVFAVGPEVPEARAAAGEARVVFERVRAEVYLERLDAILAGRPVASSLEPSSS
jgi:hypothetical protein